VQVEEQPDRARERQLQGVSELVDQADADLDEILAGPHQCSQTFGRGAVGGQVGQPVTVGADGVGQDVGVKPVVLAGAPVPRPQVLHHARCHDHHR
jgi:hypothetical protein